MENRIVGIHDQTGELSLPKSSDPKKTFDYALKRVRILETKTNARRYVFGHLFKDGKFIEAPFSVRYIRVNDLVDHSTFIHFNLTIFSKDYSQHMEYEGSPRNLIQCFNLINFLNRFIEYRNSFDRLDIKFLSQRLNVIGNANLVEVVKSIKIELYEDSISRVGKDNTFWTDGVFWTYSTGYMKSLLIEFLTTHFHKPKIIHNDEIEEYHVTIERDSAWAPAFKRRAITDSALEMEIRIKLAIWMTTNYQRHLYDIDLYELKDGSDVQR